MKHPDEYNGFLDWEIYGPKDPEITQLVFQLAYDKQLGLAEIESVIKEALRQRNPEPRQTNGTDDKGTASGFDHIIGDDRQVIDLHLLF